jgi:hypothetical protein
VRSLSSNFISLLVFSLIVTCAGYLILTSVQLNQFFGDSIILIVAFSFIALLTILIFQRGQSRESHSQTMHTLVSLSVKFLLELLLTIIWFIIAKKTSSESVLMFFVLYLTFSLFSIWNILKTLKNKSL